MRSLRSLFLALAVFSLPLLTGCGAGSVETAPASSEPASTEDDSTGGMTEEEKAEFEAGEGGA